MGGILKFEAGKAGIVLFFIAILQVLFIPQANATHLRAGQIVATRVSCTGLTFRITVTVYTNTGSTVLFGGEMDYLDFGDGSDPILVPETPNNPDPSLGPGVASASFTIEHTYSGPGRYVISYVEPNRNGGVLNMANSISTTFYIETQINIDPFFGCNNTPQLLIPPIDRACTGVAFFHNPGAFDPDGDSLSYEFVIPFRNRNETVAQYRDPNDQSFYTNFPNGNEAGDGPPNFTINPIDGTITWDAPGAQGEYNIAFIIVEWRKINGQWFRLGFVRRDMQIIVEDCDNERPDLIVPEDVCVEAGTTLNATIFGIDPENHNVKIEAFSEIFNFPVTESPATYSPVPVPGSANEFQPSNPPAELAFEWETKCFHVKELPYQVVFKITDNPTDGPKLVTFKTWRIRVVAPPPVWSSATPDFTNRSALLTWQDYTCRQEAAFIQIWRRVDSITFEPDSCQTGMPPFLGYTQVGQVAATATQFNDTGLDVGARYCYRLVAVYPQPGGGESYVSQEICIPPILADAPVITHVTIEKTSVTDGEIRVSWRAPFDADEGQFPKEPYGYDYVVERADGFAGTNYVAIHTGTLPGDTTILDTNLDTDTKIYNYRVKVFAQNQTTPFDQSASASTVHLELKPSSGRIELNWNAFVPWSNQIQSFPLHDIYRGPENATEGDLTLIASVNVFDSLFHYTDVGQHNNQPLDNNTVYCYRVMTRGGYGNPAIAVPQENFSQIICEQPVDDEPPPCKPILQAQLTNCEDFVQQEVCNFNTFSNTIYWNRPEDEECRADTRSYNVYVANSVGAPFSLLATNVTDTFYVHNDLNTFARCYRISAVDRSGNESELSDPVCNDNCPYYELPNIFTPNGDGFNDLFSAFNVREYQNCGNGEEGCQVPAHLQGRCARFVQRVELTIINRWGGEVYNYTSGGENTIFVDWDGRDSGGKPLASGIYFYKADVTFDVVDPNKRVQTIKGWVHLVR